MKNNLPTHTDDELHLADKLRPIRLSLKVAESLLSRGVSTRDTVSQALDITEHYCKEQVYFDVSSDVITASQYRGQYKDPLTLMVKIRYGTSNNMVVQDLQQLVRDINKNNLSLDEATNRYESIENSYKTYPAWLRTIGNASMATGIAMLYIDSWTNLLLTFIAACLVDVFLRFISKHRVPPFFAQSFAAFLVIILAAIFTKLGEIPQWPFEPVNPTIIAVGGIMVLVAGLSLAATAQDAIDEFYVTASARLVKSAMLTAGIAVGVILGITLISKFVGITINTAQTPAPSAFVVQVIGAAITAAAWAIHTQSSRASIAWSAIISVIGYILYVIFASTGEAVANGIASFAIGLCAAIVARFWKSPSIAIINSAILILVPGYMLYRGLMHFAGEPTTDDFVVGLMTVVNAVTIALAIAAGAALGTYLGRPIRSHMVRLHKYVQPKRTKIGSETK